MKPRLTVKVLDGLATLAGVVEAGGSADIIGYDEDQFTPENRRSWDTILTACRWIRAMQRYRAYRVAPSPVAGKADQ